ncbi:MAG: type II secretion system protein M [Hydrogenophaga sp.]|jgi:general secretion pathway protein M|uniref:type II secretion system protein GspM n=1 Tax=Hydrogenophaga sp. TaxID=1904254 RepID=UPI0026077057|nr:type II secretion system protein GspM [Hydrogenophaga sp.]MCV0439892.1 type II secretion system protein M [Hydrogenophaga sp.]
MATRDATSPFARLTLALSVALSRLSARERNAVTIAAWVIGLGLLWWLAVAPALNTLREAPARHARLDAQLGQMQRMAATAESLRGQNTTQPPNRDDALRALETATSGLAGTGQLSVLGDRATLTLRDTPPEALAQWLAQVRINARALPVDSQITREPGSPGWSGTVVLAGPALGGTP